MRTRRKPKRGAPRRMGTGADGLIKARMKSSVQKEMKAEDKKTTPPRTPSFPPLKTLAEEEELYVGHYHEGPRSAGCFGGGSSLFHNLLGNFLKFAFVCASLTAVNRQYGSLQASGVGRFQKVFATPSGSDDLRIPSSLP